MSRLVKYIKRTNRYWLIVSMIAVITILPLIPYWYKHGSVTLHDNLEAWSFFGGYLSGTVGPIVALLTLFVTGWIAVEFNDYQKRQTTIVLFKEFRGSDMRESRSNAWEVKKQWDDLNSTAYRNIFIEAMISEDPYITGEIKITKDQIRGVYDLFAFYSMLSTYKSEWRSFQSLNYFYYAWWRKFLYEVAQSYDVRRVDDLDDRIKCIDGFDCDDFFNGIKFTPKLKRLDKICGFEKLFNDEQPFDIYLMNKKVAEAKKAQ